MSLRYTQQTQAFFRFDEISFDKTNSSFQKKNTKFIIINMQISFSKNLKIYLNKYNLSLKELSNQLNIPTSTVHGWLNGTPPRSIITLKKIASLLDCSIDELCFDEGKQESPREGLNESNLSVQIDEEKYRIVLVKIK
jgi:transcriptional regulator with XRE-family HTH domain